MSWLEAGRDWPQRDALTQHYISESTSRRLVWRENPAAPATGGESMAFDLVREAGQAPASAAPWLYLVHTDIPDHIVEEYNAWYDREHLPRLVSVPGVLRARRFVARAGNPRYLTAYELTEKDAFESPAGLQARKTPWTEKMRSLFFNTQRNLCRLASPTER